MATTTLSQRLHDNLSQVIAQTEPGTRLPSEPELARKLGVSRATLREAMRIFETQGLIRRRQGSGTYVSHPARVIETGLEVLESIETLAERIGLEARMGEMKCERKLISEEEAKALEIEKYRHVLQISRVILTEDRPVAYLIDIVLDDVLSMEDLSGSFTGSVIDLLIERGSPKLASSRTEINAVTAPSLVARAMELQRGDVLLLFTALLFSATGRKIAYSYSYFLPGFFRFHIIRRVGS